MTKIGCVHRVPLFNNLACDEQSKVQELLYHKTFKKGEIIFSPDDPEQLSIISAGAMRIYKLWYYVKKMDKLNREFVHLVNLVP